ncbi:MAG: DNA polymerase IV [archaeon]|jgi:DNA polymerase IV (DinB-like DNA polymerase)
MKIIALLDLDYFYAQCEQIRNPALKNKPVVIVMPTIRGGGAIATCNYAARALKIKSGMGLALAKKLSNSETVFINADKEYYKELSDKVFDIVDFFCDNVEQVSIDEAYLELTNPEGFEKAVKICENIKSKIKSELSLTCSIGLSVNKLISKIASEEKKPDGFTKILPNQVDEFLLKKQVREIHGIGPKYGEILKENKIFTIKELRLVSVQKLIALFGNVKGEQFYNFAKGIDPREVQSNREKQQLSRMMTLQTDTLSFDEIKDTLDLLSSLVYNESKTLKKNFRTCSLIIITNKYETFTKSKTSELTLDLNMLKEIEYVLLKDFLDESLQLVKRVGVRISNFDANYGTQKKLFDF